MYCCDVQELRGNISYVPDLCSDDGKCPKVLSDKDGAGDDVKEDDFVPPENSCALNLDSRSGEHPPLLIQDGEVKYPRRRDADKNRVVYVGTKEKIFY